MKKRQSTSKQNATRRKESNEVDQDIPYAEICKTFQSNVWSLMNSDISDTSNSSLSAKGSRSKGKKDNSTVSSSEQRNRLKMQLLKRKPQLGLGRISTYFLESEVLRYSMYEYLTNKDMYNLSCTCSLLTFYPEGIQSLYLYRLDQPLINKIKGKIKEGACSAVKRLTIIENTVPTLIKTLSSCLYLLKNLNTLDIERNEIDYGSIRYLVKTFLNTKKGLPKIEKLILRNNIIAQYGTKLIIPTLPVFQHLKYINIGRNGFQDNGILDLCDPAILPNCPSLTSLVLTYDAQKKVDDGFVSEAMWESIENFRDNFSPEVRKSHEALDSLSQLKDFFIFFSRHYTKRSNGGLIFGNNRQPKIQEKKQQTSKSRADAGKPSVEDKERDENKNMQSAVEDEKHSQEQGGINVEKNGSDLIFDREEREFPSHSSNSSNPEPRMKIPRVTLFSKSGVPDIEELNSVQRLHKKRTNRSTIEMPLYLTELIVPILPSIQFLSELELCGNALTCSAIQQLSMALPYCHSLKKLNLDDNNVSSLGLIVLCSSLEKVTSLEVLSLRYNRIYALGIEDGLAAYLTIKGVNAFDKVSPASRLVHQSNAIDADVNSKTSYHDLSSFSSSTSLPFSSSLSPSLDCSLGCRTELEGNFQPRELGTSCRSDPYQNFISNFRIRSIDLRNNELKLKGCDILADVLSNLTDKLVTELELEDQNVIFENPYINVLVETNGAQETEIEALRISYDPYVTSSLMTFN